MWYLVREKSALLLLLDMHDRTQTEPIWPVGTSEMHGRVRAHDWAATPLGPMRYWLPSLKFAVDHTLAAGFPTLLLWGRHLIQFYNDAYLEFMDWREVPLGIGFKTTWPEFYARGKTDFKSVWRGETIVAEPSYFSHAQFRDGRPAWLTASIGPVRDEAGSVAGISIAMVDSTKEVLAEATSRENEAQLTQLLELLPVGVCLFDSDRNILRRNPEMQRLFKDCWGDGPHRMYDRDGHFVEPHEYPSARALRGEVVPFEHDVLLEFGGEKRWLRTGAVPIVRDGKVAGGVAIAYDVTESRESADRMQVLVAELQHRTRNLIAVVRAVAGRTLQGSASLGDFEQKYSARLAALARVQGLLSRLREGDSITFDEMLRAELSAHAAFANGDTHVTLDGLSGVRLRSSTVQTFALALHELATNAVKYGALSQAGARLAVRWHVEPAADSDGQQLCVDWRESGVVMPEAGAKCQSGYGRELIERALPYQLGARTTYELGACGVHCTLSMPLAINASARHAEAG